MKGFLNYYGASRKEYGDKLADMIKKKRAGEIGQHLPQERASKRRREADREIRSVSTVERSTSAMKRGESSKSPNLQLQIDPTCQKADRPTKRASSRTDKGDHSTSKANRVVTPKGSVARMTSPGADRTVSPTAPGIISEPLKPTEEEDNSQGWQSGRSSRSRGVDDEAVRAAEERRRSKSNSATLEGEAFRVDRITQVKELEAVVTGLTGGVRSTYEKQEEYERRIAGMREAAKEAKADNTRSGYWQGIELWDAQIAMSVCLPIHHWRHIEQFSFKNNTEVR